MLFVIFEDREGETEFQGAKSLNKLEMLSLCYFVLSHTCPECHQVLCLEASTLKPWCLHARAALFLRWNGSSPAPWAQQFRHRDPTGCSAVGQDGEMGSWVPPGSTLAAAGVWAQASAVRAQPPAALGAPAARGACRVLPSLYLWKSLIEMQVIKSNVSCSIHFHCTTTFTSPILSGISAAPLSGFFLVRAMAILSPLCELGGGDNSKPAVDY